MTIANGTRIGPYEVLGWLGAGGMGDVYRARDARLGRDVAIKLIADALANDTSRVRRFEQEARAVGQLSHPNILAVYDVGLHEGSPYIVSELLEGESLRSLLHGGPLALRKAVDYARQTADGLAAAHEKNIVHRDIKPDNLFITSSGRVKILDFGIAKLTRPTDDAPNTDFATATAEGMVVGTAGYMSPEQVRGEEVDARSDIFSVGTVLFEMLTGQSAFVRGTAIDTMSAILQEDPTEKLAAKISPSLERIVARCLEKTREMRFQSARDLAFGLEVLSDTGAKAIPPEAASVNRRRVLFGSAVAVLIVAAAMIYWRTRDALPVSPDNPLASARLSRLTDWPSAELGAQISPDGKFVAFISDHDGPLNLFLNQVGTGQFRNLTRDLPGLSAPSILRTAGFSGDSGDVWFTEPGDGGNPKWLIPVTGGTPRAFLGQHAAAPSWSPDDRRLAYFRNDNGDPLYLADRTGGDAQPLVVDDREFFTDKRHSHNPVWSSDGQWIYFVHGRTPDDLNVWRVRPSGGTPEQLTTSRGAVNYVAPLDARTLLYVAKAEDGSGPWLWSIDLESKVTRRVISGLEHYSSISASRDGRRVVATVENPTATLWKVPLLDPPAEDRDVQPYPQTRPRASAPRFGKQALFFLSDRGAGTALWVSKNGQPASEVWSTQDQSLTEPVAVSPDGASVAIVVRQAGKLRLLAMAADGTNARTLAPAIEIRGANGQGSADWSPDGDWIVAAGSDAQGSGIFKIPVDGSKPVRLVSGDVLNPIWSPHRDLIVYGGAVVAGRLPLLGVTPGGVPVKLPDVLVRLYGGYRFLPDGNVVYLPHGQSLDFWLLDLAAKTTHPLTHLSDQGILKTFDIAPDGQSIVFDRSRDISHIVLIDLPKP